MMDFQELANWLFQGSEFSCDQDLLLWLKHSERFRAFVFINRKKIKRKIAQAKTYDDRSDVLMELRIAHLLLQEPGLDLEYETDEHMDFTAVLDKSIEFNVEVKHIRESRDMNRLDEVFRNINEALSLLPTGLCYSIDAIGVGNEIALIGRLEKESDSIVDNIRKILFANQRLGMSEEHRCPLSGFENEFELRVTRSKAPGDADRTIDLSILMPIPYTQKEHYKFGDIICNSLKQLNPNTPNVLVIGITSTTQDPRNMWDAIKSFYRIARAGDEDFFKEKGFHSAGDFQNLASRLSVIIARDFKWQSLSPDGEPNTRVCQITGAKHPLPDQCVQRLIGLLSC